MNQNKELEKLKKDNEKEIKDYKERLNSLRKLNIQYECKMR